MMNNKHNFIFDCDDVLCLLLQNFLNAVGKMESVRGIKQLGDFAITPEKFISMPSDTFELVGYQLQRTEALERAIPLTRAVETTQMLHDMDIGIHIVTARGWHSNARELTTRWLDRWGFYYDEVHIVGIDASKEEILSSINNPIGFVDDRGYNIEAGIQAGIPNLFLFDQPWNVDTTFSEKSNVTRVFSHHDLQKEIMECLND